MIASSEIRGFARRRPTGLSLSRLAGYGGALGFSLATWSLALYWLLQPVIR